MICLFTFHEEFCHNCSNQKGSDEQVSSIALFCSGVGLQCRKSQGIKAGVSVQEIITMNARPLKRSVSYVWFITSHKTCLSGTSYPQLLLWVKPFKQAQSPVMHQSTWLCTDDKEQSSSLQGSTPGISKECRDISYNSLDKLWNFLSLKHYIAST